MKSWVTFPSCIAFAFMGLLHVTRLLDQSADVNAKGGRHDNALHAASYQGHEQTTMLFVNKGAYIN